MGKNYNLIASVGIELNSPISEKGSYGHLLIVGPLPAVAGATPPADFGAYSSVDEVKAAGWEISGAGADPVGQAALVAFSQYPKPSKIFIAPIKETNGTAEAAVETIQRAIRKDGWYIVCTAGVAITEYNDIADYIETQERLFLYTDLDFFSTATVATSQTDEEIIKPVNTPVVSGEKYRTIAVFGKETKEQTGANVPEANKYANVAFAAKWLSYQSGTETAAFKELNGITPSDLSPEDMDTIKGANVNLFVTVGNRNITIGGKVLGGEWADIIRFRDWLKNDMQDRIANLFATRAKIPFNDAGISLVQNQMVASLKAGQDIGGIAADEFSADGNMIPGFTTTVPTAASLTPEQKRSRDLTGCTFTARLAGAIHFAEISGHLTYEI